ncbi:hypothetical protein [Paenibacillus anseongense]|uniref:hypothetical protein n=1 Tax=Paenibacillus TaxID=44249 RepID=UPI002DB7C416|nr:hypothetical protein [Paenibacillus anseongense]MEC0266474.1 hypothetical protein [Paenibacillus anseongense]
MRIARLDWHVVGRNPMKVWFWLLKRQFHWMKSNAEIEYKAVIGALCCGVRWISSNEMYV